MRTVHGIPDRTPLKVTVEEQVRAGASDTKVALSSCSPAPRVPPAGHQPSELPECPACFWRVCLPQARALFGLRDVKDQ